eukprot:CAMPEP_0197517788 /NCGR_PEP_ID=MMETSP1318-20131121/2864_1 /TAXON_ID=552666 /ORGANISM="Partenskyella glossopodia, Strain RCC365" /LENGTH=274 /DNA_ID=CAMNT_0043067633 /DNA_START=244 /DNA_END=1068 /DNA_ORIENTATION=-
MLGALSRILDPEQKCSGLTDPVTSQLQLWGAGQPGNIYHDVCFLDPVTNVGICGDWMVAPSVEGAALSGVALGDSLADVMGCDSDGNVGGKERFAVGIIHQDSASDPKPAFSPVIDAKDMGKPSSAASHVGAFGRQWRESLARAARGGVVQPVSVARSAHKAASDQQRNNRKKKGPNASFNTHHGRYNSSRQHRMKKSNNNNSGQKDGGGGGARGRELKQKPRFMGRGSGSGSRRYSRATRASARASASSSISRGGGSKKSSAAAGGGDGGGWQ